MESADSNIGFFNFRLKRLKTRSLGIASQSCNDIFMKECVNLTKYCLNGDVGF